MMLLVMEMREEIRGIKTPLTNLHAMASLALYGCE